LRVREKKCVSCERFFAVLFRASPNGKRDWYFYCINCLEIIKRNNNLYHYGGTWKSKKVRWI